jgi:hypothetical protein
MLTDPKRAISGPNEPPRFKPGHRGQLARLIRERPVFVNLAAWGMIPKNGTGFSEKSCPTERQGNGRIQQG